MQDAVHRCISQSSKTAKIKIIAKL